MFTEDLGYECSMVVAHVFKKRVSILLSLYQCKSKYNLDCLFILTIATNKDTICHPLLFILRPHRPSQLLDLLDVQSACSLSSLPIHELGNDQSISFHHL